MPNGSAAASVILYALEVTFIDPLATRLVFERFLHDDRKDLRRFVERQRTYMRQEAAKLRATPWSALPMQGRIRKLRVVAPFATLFYALIAKRA